MLKNLFLSLVFIFFTGACREHPTAQGYVTEQAGSDGDISEHPTAQGYVPEQAGSDGDISQFAAAHDAKCTFGGGLSAEVKGQKMYITNSQGQTMELFQGGVPHFIVCSYMKFATPNVDDVYFTYVINKTLMISRVDVEALSVVWSKNLGLEKIGQSYFYPRFDFSRPTDTVNEFVVLMSKKNPVHGCFGVETEGECLVTFDLVKGEVKSVVGLKNHSKVANSRAVDLVRNHFDNGGNYSNPNFPNRNCYVISYVDPAQCTNLDDPNRGNFSCNAGSRGYSIFGGTPESTPEKPIEVDLGDDIDKVSHAFFYFGTIMFRFPDSDGYILLNHLTGRPITGS